MNSDDPFVPSLKEFEVNIAMEHERNGDKSTNFPIIDFNYGIMKNVQATIETSYATSKVDGVDFKDFDALELAVKWLFYEGDRFAMALYPKYTSYPIKSAFDEGESFEIATPVNLILNEHIDLIINSSYIMPSKGENHFEFGTYLKFKQSKHTYYTELLMENVDNRDEDASTLGAVGYMYQFYEDIGFMISWSKKINANNSSSTVYSGLQFIF